MTGLTGLQTSLSLDFIDSVHDFVANIEKIDISYQTLSVIDDHSLRKYAPIIPRSDYMLWLDKSLESCFEELTQKRDKEVSSQRLTNTLEQVLRFTQYMKVFICMMMMKSISLTDYVRFFPFL